jgi:hypothetical protein
MGLTPKNWPPELTAKLERYTQLELVLALALETFATWPKLRGQVPPSHVMVGLVMNHLTGATVDPHHGAAACMVLDAATLCQQLISAGLSLEANAVCQDTGLTHTERLAKLRALLARKGGVA